MRKTSFMKHRGNCRRCRLSSVKKEGLIPAEYRTPGSLDRAAEELEKSIRDYEGRREALRKEKEKTDRNTEMAVQEGKIYESHMEQLRNSYRQGMEVLKHKAGEAGFQSLEECRPWHARIHELNALAEEIKQYDMELAAAGRMAEAERTAVAGQKIPKMEDYDRTMKELQEAFGKSGEEKSRASLQLRRLREALEKIKSWETAQSAAAEKYSLVGGLYELASGRGTGVNFERFVLGALLDEVTESANRRLQQMSRRDICCSVHGRGRMPGKTADLIWKFLITIQDVPGPRIHCRAEKLFSLPCPWLSAWRM
mgnify:CR=1 FL=1